MQPVPGAAIMVGSWPLAAGSWFPEHTHNAHQLNWAVGGVLGVRVGDRSWILPPTLALWLPAGVPHRTRGLAALATAAGSSRRTVSRLFVQDTGLSFERWRRHLRVRAVLPMLAEGRPVDAVARAVGYATPSAFLAAFRGVVGTSPSRYLGRRD